MKAQKRLLLRLKKLEPKTLKVAELFAGVGGFRLGLENYFNTRF